MDFVTLHQGGDYGSEFENDSEVENKRKRRRDLAGDDRAKSSDVAAVPPSKRLHESESDREEARIRRFHVLSMDAYSRHKMMVNNYLMYYNGSKSDFGRDSSRDKTDLDIIRENHRFLWDDDDERDDDSLTWEKKLAKKYYDKLFKEYCIADLSRYKENKIALRWRIEKELIAGKGQFVCGNKKCAESEGLRSWEVNFAYVEANEKKNALVKLRLCPRCSYKLNYNSRKREVVKGPSTSRRSTGTTEKQSVGEKSAEKNVKTVDSQASTSIWEGPVKLDVEKSKDDEFEEYLDDLFL
ncbi:protein FRA10AC1 homolog [Tubulanus polymorphus]|uniref:protein FRA10AC1 homolog n=1 Tax=Tubulanus polymorphus TaxID=672921 RepID=UPI003DA42B21